MVVGLVVRIRNLTSRTFHLTQAGDPFYRPTVGGEPLGDAALEIPPGFDQLAEGLVIPWAATSRCGLVLREVGVDDAVRCVVGPNESDNGGTDWLRFHRDQWEPIAQAKWVPLGRRHFLGAIGDAAELQLTFEEPGAPTILRGADRSTPAVSSTSPPRETQSFGVYRIADCMRFEKEVAVAPGNTVFLNVYDLASAASIPNAMLCNTIVKTFGAFHAAVEVYGVEWGFYRQPNPEDCGICRSRRPRHHPVHVYRQSVNLGQTKLRDWEVWDLVKREVIPAWPSRRYDLINQNCIHFADEFVKLLGVEPVPSWVKGLHETGAALMKLPWPLSFFGGRQEGQDPQAGDCTQEELLEGFETLDPDAEPFDDCRVTTADGHAVGWRPDFLPDVNARPPVDVHEFCRSDSDGSFASVEGEAPASQPTKAADQTGSSEAAPPK